MSKCKECMKDAPYSYCCKYECGQHEFCRGCKAESADYNKRCNQDKNAQFVK